MDGLKPNPVISFLDDLSKKNALYDAEHKIAEDPTIKMRKLQATKDDGREKCLCYIFGNLCGNAVPSPGEVPYTPAPIPDLDKVVNNYTIARTGGQRATFYVKEAIRKHKSTCAKNILESVDKILNEMYLEKEMNPESITEEDLEFKLTPEVEDKLVQTIRDNNLDQLAEAIKGNVRADAVEEVIAAKKDKDERMAFENELKNDPTITTPEQIQEAVNNRYDPKDMVYYQPRLLEGIMMKHYTEAVNLKKSGKLTINSMEPWFESSILGRLSHRFDGIPHNIPKYSERLADILRGEYSEIQRAYHWNIMPINIDMLISKLERLIEDGIVEGGQELQVINIKKDIEDVNELRKTLKEVVRNEESLVNLPPRKGKLITLEEIPEKLQKTIDMIKIPTDYEADIMKYTRYAEEICRVHGKDGEDIETTYLTVLIAAMLEIEIMSALIHNAHVMIRTIVGLLEEQEKTRVATEAFVGALYEYTMFNIAKALKLESFSLSEINATAEKYAQYK